jgi:SAM-dependent methyltransferase
MKDRPFKPLLQFRRLALSIEAFGFRGAIVDLYQRLSESLRNEGFMGTLDRIVRKPLKGPEDAKSPHPAPFDLVHGTDTGGFIYGAGLSTQYGSAYIGSSPSSLRQALSELPLHHEDFTFIDLGCGKGRALLVAAEFPFRRLLGVEIATELCDIARANVATNPDWAARISIVNQHAKSFTYPDGPLLLYLYNPFFAPALRRALKNLERQLHRSPRPAFILYADNPRFTQVIDSFPFLREISETSYPLSPEDAELHALKRTEERYTLYSADVTR